MLHGSSGQNPSGTPNHTVPCGQRENQTQSRPSALSNATGLRPVLPAHGYILSQAQSGQTKRKIALSNTQTSPAIPLQIAAAQRSTLIPSVQIPASGI